MKEYEAYGVWNIGSKSEEAYDWKMSFARTSLSPSQSCAATRIIGDVSAMFEGQDDVSVEWGSQTGFNDLKAGVDHQFMTGYKIWSRETTDRIFAQKDA